MGGESRDGVVRCCVVLCCLTSVASRLNSGGRHDRHLVLARARADLFFKYLRTDIKLDSIFPFDYPSKTKLEKR